MNVVDMVFFWAKTDPHRPAIIQTEMVTTFQGLADAVESISDRIDRLGLDQSEPIAVSIANPSFFIAAAFAVLRSGYSVALVHPPLYPQLQPAGIRNLIYDTQGLVLSGGRNIRFDMSWLPAATPSAPRKPYRRRSLGDVNVIRFTSGTTGLPKSARDEEGRIRAANGLSGDELGQRGSQEGTDHARDRRLVRIQPHLRDAVRRQDRLLCAVRRGRTLADRYFRHRCRGGIAATGPGSRRDSGEEDPLSAVCP